MRKPPRGHPRNLRAFTAAMPFALGVLLRCGDEPGRFDPMPQLTSRLLTRELAPTRIYATQDELRRKVSEAAHAGGATYRSLMMNAGGAERLWWYQHVQDGETTLTLACEQTQRGGSKEVPDEGWRWLGVVQYRGRKTDDGWIALHRSAESFGEPPLWPDGTPKFIPERDDARDADTLLDPTLFEVHPYLVCGLLPERLWLRCALQSIRIRPAGAYVAPRNPRSMVKHVEHVWFPASTSARPLSVCRVQVEVPARNGTTEKRYAVIGRDSIGDNRCAVALYFSTTPDEQYECVSTARSAVRVATDPQSPLANP